jgi:hypothetical protein
VCSAVIFAGGECALISFLVSSEKTERSFFESTHSSFSAQNCRSLTEAGRGSGRTTSTLFCPKM